MARLLRKGRDDRRYADKQGQYGRGNLKCPFGLAGPCNIFVYLKLFASFLTSFPV